MQSFVLRSHLKGVAENRLTAIFLMIWNEMAWRKHPQTNKIQPENTVDNRAAAFQSCWPAPQHQWAMPLMERRLLGEYRIAVRSALGLGLLVNLGAIPCFANGWFLRPTQWTVSPFRVRCPIRERLEHLREPCVSREMAKPLQMFIVLPAFVMPWSAVNTKAVCESPKYDSTSWTIRAMPWSTAKRFSSNSL